jgi:hypothetical protein
MSMRDFYFETHGVHARSHLTLDREDIITYERTSRPFTINTQRPVDLWLIHLKYLGMD